jgi:hypothetical protein
MTSGHMVEKCKFTVPGNGGGYIIAAEFLLQLLTPKQITPEPAG